MKTFTKAFVAVLTALTGLLAINPTLSHAVGDAASTFVYAHPTWAVVVSSASAILALVHDPKKVSS